MRRIAPLAGHRANEAAVWRLTATGAGEAPRGHGRPGRGRRLRDGARPSETASADRDGPRPPSPWRRSCPPAAPARRRRPGRAARARSTAASDGARTARAARRSRRPCHEHGVDREAHEHHVDPVAGRQPQAVAGRQRAPAHQAHELGPERAGGLEPLGEHGRPRLRLRATPAPRDAPRRRRRPRPERCRPRRLARRRPRRDRQPRSCRLLHDQDDGRAEDDDEQRREDAPDEREQHLDRRLGRLSSARCRRSMRSCSDWTWSTLEIETPSCSAWMIAPMKFVSAGTSVRGMMSRSASRRALPTRISASARRNSSDERALELLDDLAQRGVEAEAGADGDRQQVEGVRDLQQDRPSGACLTRPPSQNSGIV